MTSTASQSDGRVAPIGRGQLHTAASELVGIGHREPVTRKRGRGRTVEIEERPCARGEGRG